MSTSTPGLLLFDAQRYANNTGTFALSAEGKKAAGIFCCPAAGAIRYIGMSFSAISSPPAFDVRLETVTSLVPSGTLVNAGASATYTPAGTDSFVWTQLGTDGTVTQGKIVAAVVSYPTGGTGSGTVRFQGNNAIAWELPFSADATASAWTTRSHCPAICLKYDDGTIIGGGYPANATATGAFATGSNPNERAVVWTQPFAATLVGARIWIGSAASTNVSFSINLYSGTSTTPLMTHTPDANPQLVNIGPCSYFFPAVNLVSGTTYRLSVKSLGTSNVQVCRATFPSTAERDACFGRCWSDTRAGSSWIGESTTTSEMICPIIGSVTTGGIRRVLMDGGMPL